MHHGITNERLEMEMAREQDKVRHGKKEGNGSVDAGGDLGSAAKESAIGLGVASSGLVSCCVFIPFSFLPCVVLYPILGHQRRPYIVFSFRF